MPIRETWVVICHIGLRDNETGLDTRRLALAEITQLGNYTYTVVGLRRSITALYREVFADIDFIERRPLPDGPQEAFHDLHCGAAAAQKIVLVRDSV